MMRQNMFVTIFDGSQDNNIINLAEFDKSIVRFGRGHDNDIVLESTLASKHHGYFEFNGVEWEIYDDNSTNGIFWNERRIRNKQLVNGDKLLIGYEYTSNRVAFAFSKSNHQNIYKQFPLSGKNMVIIGRELGCDICISHSAVFKQHCKIIFEEDGYYLKLIDDNAPVQYNGNNLVDAKKLNDMDRFLIGDMQFIYQNQKLYYNRILDGLSFEVSHLSKIIGRGNKRKRINNDITFSVNAGEFVVIIGGSGAGKSTLLNCLCGCSKISEGSIAINGEDLVSNYNSLKNLIGYVPQQDIIYDNLTLERMLYYTAKLRMPKDATENEIQQGIKKALDIVELSEKKDVLIKSLSGGQKKRASIAVELLSDPKLFFLDEPTSGLDPGTERNLMMTLKSMTIKGKTVVLVTHTPLNLHLCDKVVILGKGGHLCFCGSPQNAKEFFGTENFVDIYDLINNDALKWADKFNKQNTYSLNYTSNEPIVKKYKLKNKASGPRQFKFLVLRYIELIIHDYKRLLIQLLMAPGLGVLLYLAFSQLYPFKASYDTQKLALTLGCCAFWIGLFNSIQEICKESQVYRRERMANLKLFPYVGSKILVTGVLDIIQTALLISVVSIMLGTPQTGMQISASPMLELFITTYLTMFSATCLGLLVSSIVSNSDQAISIAPLLLIPQILFSGIIVDLEGIIEQISYIISCRYACVAYCTTANINNIPSEFKLTALGVEEGETVIIDSLYSYSANAHSGISGFLGEELTLKLSNPIMLSWLALAGLCIIATIITIVALKRNSKK